MFDCCEGIPVALALVDALQLILPEPGNQVQHEHGYVYARMLKPQPDSSGDDGGGAGEH